MSLFPEKTTSKSSLIVPESTSALLLASRSPRRRRLLQWLGLPFNCEEASITEIIPIAFSTDPSKSTSYLAEEKAFAARKMFGNGRTILCFDTLVFHDGQTLGKPENEDDARAMLRSLSGQIHQVTTGMALWFPEDDTPISGAVTTNVRMNELSDEDIEAWLAKNEYKGCAGSYNIEAQVASVDDDECFQNVAGLPLCHVYKVLKDRLPFANSLLSPCITCNSNLARCCALAPKVLV